MHSTLNELETHTRGRGLRLHAGARSTPLPEPATELFYDVTEFPLIRAFPVPRLS